MKPIRFAFFATLALAVLAVGCASKPQMLDQENAAMGAGFKVVTPTRSAQLIRLEQLPLDKVTPVTFGGKRFYALPDPVHHRAYVGGPKQYQAYLQFRREQVANASNYQSPAPTVVVVEGDALDWGPWDGWGSADELAGLGAPGWY